jgi:hypothetical protein
MLPVDEVTPETATYHNTVYPSRNQIMCIGERQWNIVLVLPPQHMVGMVAFPPQVFLHRTPVS